MPSPALVTDARPVGKYTVDYEDETMRVGNVDNLTIAAWFDAPTLVQMRAVDRSVRRIRREVEGGVGFINVVVEGIPSFSAEVREEGARQTSVLDGRDLVAAHVILIGGLTGVAVRMFMSTVILLGRPGYPTKVFGDAHVAATWLSNQLSENEGYPWSVEQLEGLLEEAAEPI